MLPVFSISKNKSQIYGQALNGNVSLFSWEYFSLLLNNNITETIELNLSTLWNWSNTISETTTIQNKNTCFITRQNEYLKSFINLTADDFEKHFEICKRNIILRSEKEIEYWQNKITLIQNYSRDEAINMLIKSLKLNEKINSITIYINQLRG